MTLLYELKIVLYATIQRIKSIMLIQIAEDAAASRAILRGMLKKLENEALVMANNTKYWQVSQQPGAFALAILGRIPEAVVLDEVQGACTQIAFLSQHFDKGYWSKLYSRFKIDNAWNEDTCP
jgi:hypothetical protein